MSELDRLRAGLGAAMNGAHSALAAADQLCCACVDLLEVDGASISLMYDGTTRGTFGSSGELSRRLDELQFTFGEGPCLDAVAQQSPVLVSDLDDPGEQRWPAFRGAVLSAGIRSVFALPVAIATTPVGALDLFRHGHGPLGADHLRAGLLAADLAALPLLDMMSSEADWEDAADSGDGAQELAPLDRVEVYQATGMIIAALDIGAADALVRLRAYAFTHDMTASEVAWAIVERTVSLDTDDWQREDGD